MVLASMFADWIVRSDQSFVNANEVVTTDADCEALRKSSIITISNLLRRKSHGTS